jgi:hypothetical protein
MVKEVIMHRGQDIPKNTFSNFKVVSLRIRFLSESLKHALTKMKKDLKLFQNIMDVMVKEGPVNINSITD